MPALLRMPGVAANATDAILSEWQVPENTDFAKADAIATVETDKANVDIEAESDGVILRYLVTPGSTVEVGSPIALTALPGETVTDIDQVLRDLGVTAEDEGRESSGSEPQAAASSAVAAQSQPAQYGADDGTRLFVTPLVRRLAREADLDLTRVSGTGPNGRIVKRDIESHLAGEPSGDSAPPAAAPTAAESPAMVVGDTTSAGFTDHPHTKMRRAIAARLVASKQTAPHFYVRGSARIDALLDLRVQLNRAAETKISVNDLIVKAAARAHLSVPAMNVIWLDDAVRQFDTVDISVAVASDRGLVTPVVRDVGRRSIATIAAETKDLADRARKGKLKQSELEGGSLSVSNLGMFGTEEFSAIINPPQAAILAVGAAQQQAVVVDGQVAVASVLKVTMSVDHRPVDGAVAAEWMEVFLDFLHNPLQILV